MPGLEDLSPADLKAHRLGIELMKNPEITRQAMRLAKKANPALQLPVEIELEDQVAASEARAREREQKLSDDLMQERVLRRQREEHEKIRAAGLEPADVERIMVEEKCSYATAMKLAASEQRSAEPTGGAYRGGHNQGDPIELRPAEEFRKAGASGLGALRKVSAKIAGEMIDQFRGRRSV